MVKRSRDQSQEAPSRFSWLMMAPPDSAFHSQTRLRNSSRPMRGRRLLALHQLALDHHLRRDAGMVGARLPQHVLAAHALEAGQHVLQRVVERVADMQRAGDIGRRNDDAIGLGRGALRPAGAEGARLLPGLVNAAFDRAGLVSIFDHFAFAIRRGRKPGLPGLSTPHPHDGCSIERARLDHDCRVARAKLRRAPSCCWPWPASPARRKCG